MEWLYIALGFFAGVVFMLLFLISKLVKLANIGKGDKNE